VFPFFVPLRLYVIVWIFLFLRRKTIALPLFEHEIFCSLPGKTLICFPLIGFIHQKTASSLFPYEIFYPLLYSLNELGGSVPSLSTKDDENKGNRV
jgi:hypothetical protein